MEAWFRSCSSLNGCFVGSMLIFQGVLFKILNVLWVQRPYPQLHTTNPNHPFCVTWLPFLVSLDWTLQNKYKLTLPETNSHQSPWKWWLRDYFPFGVIWAYFQGFSLLVLGRVPSQSLTWKKPESQHPRIIDSKLGNHHGFRFHA